MPWLAMFAACPYGDHVSATSEIIDVRARANHVARPPIPTFADQAACIVHPDNLSSSLRACRKGCVQWKGSNMEMTLSIDVLPSAGGLVRIEKPVDLPFIPPIGMEMEQQSLPTRKVTGLAYHVEQKKITVRLAEQRVADMEQADSLAALFKAEGGWQQALSIT